MIGWYINDEGEQQMYVYSPFKPTQAMFMMDMASKIIECRPPDLVDDFDWRQNNLRAVKLPFCPLCGLSGLHSSTEGIMRSWQRLLKRWLGVN